MTLQKRLEVLQQQYDNMIKYRALCNGIDCTINYSSIDFDREGELLRKIQETKEWMAKKN